MREEEEEESAHWEDDNFFPSSCLIPLGMHSLAATTKTSPRERAMPCHANVRSHKMVDVGALLFFRGESPFAWRFLATSEFFFFD